MLEGVSMTDATITSKHSRMAARRVSTEVSRLSIPREIWKLKTLFETQIYMCV